MIRPTRPRRVQYPMPFEGRISRQEVWESLSPSWEQLNHPLVQYEIRSQQRRGRQPRVALAVGIFTVIFFLIALFTQPTAPKFSLLVLVMGALAYVVLGRLRLLIAISAQATRMIVTRRERGDWDLILITPMPKAQWLTMQLTALIWQTWPIIRGLMVGQAVFVLLLVGYLAVEQHENRENEAYYDSFSYSINKDAHYLPAPVFVILALPVGALTIFLPMLEAGMYASAALTGSAESRESAFSILRGLVNLGVGRLVVAVGTVILPMMFAALGGLILLVFPTEDGMGDLILVVVVGLGMTFVVLGGYYISIPLLSLVWEWIPLLGIFALMLEMPYQFHIVITLTFLFTLPITHGYIPFEWTASFLTTGLRQLSRRD